MPDPCATSMTGEGREGAPASHRDDTRLRSAGEAGRAPASSLYTKGRESKGNFVLRKDAPPHDRGAADPTLPARSPEASASVGSDFTRRFTVPSFFSPHLPT